MKELGQRTPHEAIMASAGAGKTYVLTTRYIRLLDTFRQPERIIALTFTRAAAGEFFERIVNRLAEAAAGEAAAVQLSHDIGAVHGAAHYRQLLRQLLQSLHRLNLQTLDSFFFRMASCFALELGMAGRIRLMDEADALRARQRVFREMLDRRFGVSSERESGALAATIADFAVAYKQATYGEENRSVRNTVSDYVENLLPLFRACREAARWGAPESFWGNGFPWQRLEACFAELASDLLVRCPESLGKQQLKAFETLAQKLREYPATRSVKFNTLFERAFEVWEDLRAGAAVVVLGRGKNSEVTISGAWAETLNTILTAVVADQLHFRLKSTQATHTILQRYDECYERLVRGNGLLAFDDVVDLLNRPDGAAPHLCAEAREEARMWLDYRMDGMLDHWLFDEFQDTSRRQWSVVENLVDEVVQDVSGRRSLFYVGDTKQCLYLWRQSDDRLFHAIRQRYAGLGDGGLQLRTLPHSWRSSPAILEVVNRIFGDNSAIAAHFNEAVAARWQMGWSEHAAAGNLSARGGAVYYAGPEAAADADEEPFARIGSVLQGLRPLERGLSVGILVRTNSDALTLSRYLKMECGLPATTSAAAVPAVDNPAGLVVCSVLSLAAHPGDSFAEGHLKIFEASSGSGGERSLRSLVGSVRRVFTLNGSEACVRFIVEALRQYLSADESFLLARLELLIEAARLYEGESEASLDGLLSALRNYKRDGGATQAAIVVETIHHAKGLEYDVVFYYERETRNVGGRVPSMLIERDERGMPHWLMKSPPRMVCEADPQLRELLRQAEDQSGYEALCRLYVCLTRARRALYIIHSGKRSESQSLSGFIAARLQGEASVAGDGWTFFHGQADWIESHPLVLNEAPISPAVEVVAADLKANKPAAESLRSRLTSVRPSQSDGGNQRASMAGLLRLEQAAVNFGSAVHAVFEAIEVWPADEAEQQSLLSALRTQHLPEAVETVARNLGSDAVADLFRADPAMRIVRERPFAWVNDGKLHRGVFDRILIQRDAAGQEIAAHIIDFKTDRIGSLSLHDAAGRHQQQLAIYRAALAAILGLDSAKIVTSLVFTEVAQVVACQL